MIIFALALLLTCPPLVSANLYQDYLSLAQEYKQANRPEKAIELYKQASRLKPADYGIHLAIALELQKLGKSQEALEWYKKAAELKSANAETPNTSAPVQPEAETAEIYVKRGIQFDDEKKHAQAIQALLRAIELDSQCFEAHYRLGKIYRHLDNFDDSIKHFQRAHDIQPDHIGGLLELANTLNTVNRPHPCVALYKRVLELNPASLAARYNLGYTVKKLGYVKEAIEIYNDVLEKNPTYPHAHFSRALANLTLGNFEEGWKEYEWRWQAYDDKPRELNNPVWDGSPLAGKRIFVYAEQGLGDTFQFMRYLKVLKEQGAYVIFQTQKPLKTILSRCSFIDKLITVDDPLPLFDCHAALLSLPMLCKTTLQTVPQGIPYIQADPKLIDEWRFKLSHDKNFKIGICWQGNAQYRTQFLRQAVAAKSMNVNNFAPISKIPGVSLYSLQKISGTDQLNNLQDGMIIKDCGPELDEAHGRFMDTAAIMHSLDLIISVDTGTCHLAAAMGLPVWVPLPFPADWRWMLERTDTPWYPTMRLFRQTKPGDWKTVMESIANEVRELMKKKK